MIRILVLMAIAIMIVSCSNNPNSDIVIHACANMQHYIGDDSLMHVDSSPKAFELLRLGNISYAVTSRPPTTMESAGLKTITVRKGYTILSPENMVVLESQLHGVMMAGCDDEYNNEKYTIIPCEYYPEKIPIAVISWEDWEGENMITVVDDYNSPLMSIDFRGVYVTGRNDDRHIERAARIIEGMLS
ncbi:MAG: hypothetical protein ACMXYL_05360 [Candidatus Woesearchaeota archaeon]